MIKNHKSSSYVYTQRNLPFKTPEFLLGTFHWKYKVPLPSLCKVRVTQYPVTLTLHSDGKGTLYFQWNVPKRNSGVLKGRLRWV
jgi:hypothetical protein